MVGSELCHPFFPPATSRGIIRANTHPAQQSRLTSEAPSDNFTLSSFLSHPRLTVYPEYEDITFDILTSIINPWSYAASDAYMQGLMENILKKAIEECEHVD